MALCNHLGRGPQHDGVVTGDGDEEVRLERMLALDSDGLGAPEGRARENGRENEALGRAGRGGSISDNGGGRNPC